MARASLLYFASKFLAQTAQNLFLAALFVSAGTSDDAALGLSSIFLAMLIPALVFGLVGGALADRMGAARGLIAGAAGRLLATASAFLMLDFGASAAWSAAFFYSLSSQLFTPAELAVVRSLPQAAPGRAHSILVTLQYGGQAAGMLVLAPLCYLIGGIPAILAAGVIGFALVMAIAFVLLRSLGGTPAVAVQPSRDAFTFGETLRFFAEEARARYAVVTMAFKVIVARGIVVALPFYLANDMQVGHQALVYLFVPGVLGVLAGLWWCSRNCNPARSGEVMRLSLAGMVTAVFALAVLDLTLSVVAQASQVPPIMRLEASVNTTFAVALPAAFLLGAALSGALVSSRVALTETAPAGQQARVFAVQGTLTDALLVAPLFLTGLGTQFAGARFTLAAIGVLAVVALMALELPVLSRWLSRRLPLASRANA